MDLQAWLDGAAELAVPDVPVERRAHVGDREPGSRWVWVDQAECLGMDPDLFFPSQGEALAPEVEAACRRCMVRSDCLEYALSHERLGYWAGTTEKTRKRMRRALGIQVVEPAPLSLDGVVSAPADLDAAAVHGDDLR